MEPRPNDCPWPDFLNPVLEAAGVGKCLPTNINWTNGDGIRIVTDPLIGSSDDSGWVNFWCETKVGFKFIVGVAGLEPNATYPVTAAGITIPLSGGPPQPIDLGIIATLHTDSQGRGEVGGVVPLPSSAIYELDINVGTVLSTPDDDLVGFVVFP